VRLEQLGGEALALFGFHLPYLPDFLTDHTLLGSSPVEKLSESLSRLEPLLAGLHKFRGNAYALRYTCYPDLGVTHVDFLGRLVRPGPAAELVDAAEMVRTGLERHLISHGLACQALPLDSVDAPGLPSLGQVLQPFRRPAGVVEVRQRSKVIQLQSVDRPAYVVYPYWGPAGAGLEPFESLLNQPAPVSVSIYLEPTSLTDVEDQGLSRTAQQGQTFSDLAISTYSRTSPQRLRDPAAEMLGRIYSVYHRTLDEPFILLLQAVSPDPNTAWTVARAFGSAMLARPGGPEPGTSRDEVERALPSNCDLLPVPAPQVMEALGTFEKLRWCNWAPTPAEAGELQRLPYLVGARGASTLFRFPVSVRGGLPGMTVRQPAPDFEPGPRPRELMADEIMVGALRRGGAIALRPADLTRHALVTGFTGSGKTNTVLFLLTQLWQKQRIPFLVIESAKKEYRGLLDLPGFEDLLVFTPGSESISPFRFNPFDLLPGARLEAHLGHLQTCFNAALPQFGILPSIIGEALVKVYHKHGWDPERDFDGQPHGRTFPTLGELYTEASLIVEARGYEGEFKSNLKAAVTGRIGSLLQFSLGKMFGEQRSFFPNVLFNRPVVLELNDLNEDHKALVMMFLLMWLREYRELHPGQGLVHVTVVEEAHNVIGNVPSVGASDIAADTRAKAVAAFANLLAEVRAYGEGIIISDQSPDRLAPDALRNTKQPIALQLRDSRDRQAVARAMIMDEVQQEFLGKLHPGEAAVFQTGMEKATFVRGPLFDQASLGAAGRGSTAQQVSDAAVHTRMQPRRLPYSGCYWCGQPCAFRKAINLHVQTPVHHVPVIEAYQQLSAAAGTERRQRWQALARACAAAAAQAGCPGEREAAYCVFVHCAWMVDFTPEMRQDFVSASGG